MAVVLKPNRGKSNSLKTNHKTAANDSAQPEKKSVAVSQTLSTSTSSLGSEVVEEGSLETPRKAVQDVPNKHRTTENVETTHQTEDAGEEHTGEALMTEATVEKPRSHGRVRATSMFKCI